MARGAEAICGSAMECAGFDPAATLFPRLGTTEVLRSSSGLRPVTPDELPILGEKPRLRGFWYATGHGREGILLAGITGLVLRLVTDGQTPCRRPDRSASGGGRAQAARETTSIVQPPTVLVTPWRDRASAR